jgi:hypothetical protein
MSKPTQPVILTHRDGDDILDIQDCWDSNFYAVIYQGRPFALRKRNATGYPSPKYQRTTFPTRGWAEFLANRLNQRFETDKFEVVIIQIA